MVDWWREELSVTIDSNEAIDQETVRGIHDLTGLKMLEVLWMKKTLTIQHIIRC